MSLERYTNFAEGEDRIHQMKMVSSPDGVVVDPTPVTAESKIEVFYDGLLFKNGADAIWVYVGYGHNNQWNNSEYFKMNKTGWGFEKSFYISGYDRLNFCFKDSADNWDNNNGLNWSYEIHDGHQH